MPVFTNNRELLEQFRRGDRAALATVYRHYVDDVATVARRGFTIESSGHVVVRGAGREGEYELVQETFVKAFAEKARLAYDGVSPYRPYLLRITKNLMIDRHRADKRDARVIDANGDGLGDLDALLASGAPFGGVEEPVDLHWKSLATATQAYLATLDAESRQLVTLRFEDELSQDEVAVRAGCSRRRVRTVEERVQVGLRKWLKTHGLLD